MRKNYHWIIELITIIIAFSFTVRGLVLIGSANYNCLFGGLALSLIFCIGLLIFTIFRLNKRDREKDSHSLSRYFRKRFSTLDVAIVLALVIIGPITYRLIISIDFIHFFGMSALQHNCSLTSWQALSMLFLIFILLPVGVLAEELYFRCYLFEIQYNLFKNHTWIINGFSWSLFHLFTPTNSLAFLPTCLMYSYVYQKRRNIWITIAAHLTINFLSYYPAIRGYIHQLTF